MWEAWNERWNKQMKQRKLLSLLLAAVMVFAMLVPAAATEETAAPVEPYALPDVAGKLVVLHTNDTHGRDVSVEGETVGTPGVAALKAYLQRLSPHMQ